MANEMGFPSCLSLAIEHTKMPTARPFNWRCYFRNGLHRGSSAFNLIMLSYCEETDDIQISSEGCEGVHGPK